VSCGCDRLGKPTIIRFSVADADKGFRVNQVPLGMPPGSPWMAIAIGPESDVDRCIVVAEGADPPIATAGGLASSIDRQVDISNHAFAVSVERPWIGPVSGPFNVLMPYAHSIYGSERLKTDDQVLWQTFAGRPQYAARVELVLYPFLPPWLPTHRAPLDFAFQYPNFGATGGGGTGHTIRLPGFGRKRCSLSLEMSGRSAGSLDWTFSGVNVAETDGGIAVVNCKHELGGGTESADFDETFAFDQEFDLFELVLAENAALNAGVDIQGIFKAWDD
jgi:hypothetical protein